MGHIKQDTRTAVSKTHAQKSESMRRLLGLSSTGIFSRFQKVKSQSAVGTTLRSKSNNKPPGLGNWDNSCYQNSVIQGLASLPSFAAFLNCGFSEHPSRSTKAALKEIIQKLKDHTNLGTMFWTPTQLKSMSSWQQQDAQEYFSKLMDEVERETTQYPTKTGYTGLAALQSLSLDRADPSATETKKTEALQPIFEGETPALRQLPDELHSIVARNPLEGLLAQRVGCLKCGFVEGLSLIPFNCLTLSLGKQWLYDIRSCLDEYTALEPINGVDCAKCTLLQSKTQLEKLKVQFMDEGTGRGLQTSTPLVSEALRASVIERLNAVTEALEEGDFGDNTILKKCHISPKARISSTKTRQAIIARTPEALAIHINRSVFNEMTGALSKNHADVRFPLRFNLAQWCLGSRRSTSAVGNGDGGVECWNTDPARSMLPEDIGDEDSTDPQVYELRAALTHYGRHENGHYICYRKHEPVLEADGKTMESEGAATWWRFSDEDVSSVSEEDVLAQGDVFMLFYERVASRPTSTVRRKPAVNTEHNQIADLANATVNSTLEDEIPDSMDADERREAHLVEKGLDAPEEKANGNTPFILDSLSNHDIHAPEPGAQPSGDANSASKDELHRPRPRSNDSNGVSSEATTASPSSEHDHHVSQPSIPNESAASSSADTTAITAIDSSPSSCSPHEIHPPLLVTSPPASAADNTTNIAHSMRTATPRSGRGSVSRGKKMGQVSSMISSH
ncbi:MAG: hypothetical protein L6R40_001511 [Gallowayella cf. fulva]|nr:MAG: hypothetical protein L6R40_001511 [Xanthomendoza cf. fulva]